MNGLILIHLSLSRYDCFVMLMLPQLEHSLRRLYATVNEMPERVQTAESEEFYTTFNEVCSVIDPHI